METKRFEFLLEAVTPIAHHSEVMGNHAIAMRRKVRLPGGGWANVPAVSADSMRHGLREAIAYAYLDAAGLLGDAKLTEAALRLLFAGGMVTGRGDASSIRLDHYHEMVELMPSLALLGGCAGNRVIPGRLIVDDAVLVCAESLALVPEWILESAGEVDTCRAHVEIAQRVRMDPTLDPGKRNLLTAAAAGDVAGRLRSSEEAGATDNAIMRDDAKSSMMPRTFECVAAGSLFSWSVTAQCWTDLDADTLVTMVAAFLSSARVGGKRGTGHGLLRPLKAQGVIVSRPSERMHPLDTAALATKAGETFRAHVASRKDRVKKFLSEVDA